MELWEESITTSNLATKSFVYFASRARAIVPATRGAEALVPVKPSVHLLFSAAVLCKKEMEDKSVNYAYARA